MLEDSAPRGEALPGEGDWNTAREHTVRTGTRERRPVGGHQAQRGGLHTATCQCSAGNASLKALAKCLQKGWVSQVLSSCGILKDTLRAPLPPPPPLKAKCSNSEVECQT